MKNKTQPTDLPEILTLIQNRESHGFELLYERYYRFLFSTAYMVLQNEGDAKDVVQNVVLCLYTMEKQLFPTDHAVKWLHTVVKNEALMYARRKKPEFPVDELPELPAADGLLEDLADLDTFHSLLASLNPRQQRVVTLKVLGGMSHKEIASLLSLPVGTVQWLYNTSIKKLRRTLTVLTCTVLASAGGLAYQVARLFQTPTAQPGGDFGISSVPPVESTPSPWLPTFLILLLLSIAAWILFSNFPIVCQQNKTLTASK